MTAWKLFLSLFLGFCFLVITNTVHAGHQLGTEGWYCDKNQIWHDVPDGSHRLYEDCGGDEVCQSVPPLFGTGYTQDAACFPSGNATSGKNVSMHVKLSPVIVGEKILFGFASNKSCLSEVNTSNLRVYGRLKDCSIVEEDCMPDNTKESRQWEANPWDKSKQCWKNIECIADALGKYNAPLVTGNKSCNASVDYKLDPTPECRKSTPTTTTNNYDTKNITATSLNDDQENIQTLNKTLLPSEINEELEILTTPEAKKEIPKTGVLPDFFGSAICNLRGVTFFDRILLRAIQLSICPREVNLAERQTEYFASQSAILANSIRPEKLEITPPVRDCNIKDYEQTDPLAIGNKTVDKISTSAGTTAGFYTIDQPDFGKLQLKLNENLNTEGRVFAADERVPDINERCKLFSQANYPEGIVVCKDQ